MFSERPIVAVFGGAKGGVGRSTLCAEAARSMARQGARVLCVDASTRCPTLHTLLQAPSPQSVSTSRTRAALGEPGGHISEHIVSTGHANIWLSALASAIRSPFVGHNVRAYDLLLQLHELDFDYVFVDLPPELDVLSVGLFTLSDIPIVVCSPEPAAIRMCTQFLREVIFQAVGFHPSMEDYSDDLLDTLYELSLDFDRPGLHDNARLYGVADIVADALEHLEVYLLLNFVREGSERDMGYVLSHAWYEELGVFPRFLTSVDYEDRRWFYNRRNASMGNTRPDEALSQDIERLVRHIRALDAFDEEFPRPVPKDPQAHPALLLGLSPLSSANHIRQHCRKLWEGYRRQITVNLVFANPKKRDDMSEVLEHLYKRSLNLAGEGELPSLSSISVAHESAPTGPPPPTRPKGTSPPPVPDAPPPPALASVDKRPMSDARAPGRMIESMRLSRQMSMQDMSHSTHIGLKYLLAIEHTDLEILPRPVYLRGYLREIARVFEEDPTALMEEYFRRLELVTADAQTDASGDPQDPS